MARDLPRGTVTFLFTDVEGSTRLLKRLGDAYGDVLAEHQRILHEAFAEHGGEVVDTQGDSFFVAFARAKDAVAAAIAAQRALGSHTWPERATVRIRMGLHTGEPVVGDERYVGLGVHKAARIGAAAHGGQVLLSNATRELVEDELPSGVRLIDLGEHRLKDIERPERVYQVKARGLRQRFAPLRVEAPPPRRAKTGLPASRLVTAVAAGAALAALATGLALAITTGGDEAGSSGSGETSPRTALGRDPDTIFPGTSIGAVRLGMSRRTVEDLYGAGTEGVWVARGRNGTRLTYSGAGGALSVAFYEDRVVQIRTTIDYYSTDTGVRVGAQTPAWRDDPSQLDAALQRGELQEVAPGVYAWRDYVFDHPDSYCLRGERAATQLGLRFPSSRIAVIAITDERFLADLPLEWSQGALGTREVFCSVEPAEQ